MNERPECAMASANSPRTAVLGPSGQGHRALELRRTCHSLFEPGNPGWVRPMLSAGPGRAECVQRGGFLEVGVRQAQCPPGLRDLKWQAQTVVLHPQTLPVEPPSPRQRRVSCTPARRHVHETRPKGWVGGPWGRGLGVQNRRVCLPLDPGTSGGPSARSFPPSSTSAPPPPTGAQPPGGYGGILRSRAATATPTVVADSQGTLGMSLGWWVCMVGVGLGWGHSHGPLSPASRW